jgi:hypothetical protein
MKMIYGFKNDIYALDLCLLLILLNINVVIICDSIGRLIARNIKGIDDNTDHKYDVMSLDNIVSIDMLFLIHFKQLTLHNKPS